MFFQNKLFDNFKVNELSVAIYVPKLQVTKSEGLITEIKLVIFCQKCNPKLINSDFIYRIMAS